MNSCRVHSLLLQEPLLCTVKHVAFPCAPCAPAFLLVHGEDQDFTLNWRNQTKPSFFSCVFHFLVPILKCVDLTFWAAGSHLCEFGGRCRCHNHQILLQMCKALPGPVGFIPCASRRGCSPVSHPQAEVEEGLCAG